MKPAYYVRVTAALRLPAYDNFIPENLLVLIRN